MNLVLALLIYVAYSNLLSITQASIAQSRISPVAGLLGVHAVMLLLLAVLFYRRLMVFSLFRLVR
jgi:lipopolysaccharide export system permease protein